MTTPDLGTLIPDTDLLLVEELARSTNSIMYRARSEKIGRDFCAKFVPRSSEASRWRREVQVLSSVRSPHVVKLFRTIELPEHTVVVLDFVPGTTLGAYVAEHGPLPPQAAVSLIRQVALALAEVHAKGVVHRDLRPTNVMLSELPSGDLFACLLEFGFAKAIDDHRISVGLVGSPLYTTPEQIEELPIDARTDIYQLGCLLHFALTGQPPFNADDAAAVMNAHLYQPPPRVSAVAPWLRRWKLDDVILELLAKVPDGRPPNMEQVLRLLDASTQHLHVGETAPTSDAASQVLRAVGPDESIVTAAGDRIVVRNRANESHFTVKGRKVTALFPTLDAVLFGTSAGTIHRLDITNAVVEDILELPRSQSIVSVSRTESLIVAADEDARLLLIDPHHGGYDVIRDVGVSPLSVAGAANSREFAVVGADGRLVVFEGSRQRFVTRLATSVRHVVFAPDGYVIAVFGAGETLIVSAVDGEVLHRVATPRKAEAITFVGGTLIGVGQGQNGTETFALM